MTKDAASPTKSLADETIIDTWFDMSKCAIDMTCKMFDLSLGDGAIKEKDPLNISPTIIHTAEHLLSRPQELFTKQIELLEKQTKLMESFLCNFEGYNDQFDSRFRNELWQSNPIFRFIKESYLINSKWLYQLAETQGLESKEQHKLCFYTKFFTDALSPANFPMTNPEIIDTTIKTEGENLIRGMHNFFKDLDSSENSFKITTANLEAFEIGKNIAATAGQVVFSNRLMQLIEYKPNAETFDVPLLIMPAWINKYYILDLQQENSFAKWLVDQGYRVYMISWVNPDASYNDIEFSDYMTLGPIAAIDFLTKSLNVKQLNMMGYCLGGTLLAITLAYLKFKYKKDYPVKSATFLTTLVDFEEAGDLGVFIDEKQISMLENRMDSVGFLDGSEMAQTFSMIRANDMIWSFYVNNYFLGKDPLLFDILYWNSDPTRLPCKMHSFYLRQMYQYNNLAKGNLDVLGCKIDLKKIDIPVYMLSTKEDHIAPWKSTFKATKLYSGDVRFTLSGSGHVAGVVNHPAKNKYGHFVCENGLNKKLSADEWLANAEERPGSWWIDWHAWMDKYRGTLKKTDTLLKGLETAPGSYVKVMLNCNRQDLN